MSYEGKTQDLIRTSVYQKLRSEILSCTLRPGQQLQERELVERYQVSKSPIRDALLRLEEQGLVEVMPRRGYRVRRIDVRDVRDMYELRLLLERACVTQLIERAPDEALEALEPFRTGPEDADLALWIEYNRSFHTAIATNCQNARLARIAREMIEQFERLTCVSVTSTDDLSLGTFALEHGEIIDAVQVRDKRRAAARLREHIESSRRRVLDKLAAMSVIDSDPEGR